MATVNPKKVAAAIAAVLQHTEETELAAAAPAPVCAALSPSVAPTLWAWSGRQDAMYGRVSWQRRLSRSW